MFGFLRKPRPQITPRVVFCLGPETWLVFSGPEGDTGAESLLAQLRAGQTAFFLPAGWRMDRVGCHMAPRAPREKVLSPQEIEARHKKTVARTVQAFVEQGRPGMGVEV